jgi:hypothetical protein
MYRDISDWALLGPIARAISSGSLRIAVFADCVLKLTVDMVQHKKNTSPERFVLCVLFGVVT